MTQRNIQYSPYVKHVKSIGGGNSNAAIADWTTRSNGAGVVWAQSFQSQLDVSKYIVHGGTPLANIVPTYTSYNAGGSRLGSGYGSLLKTTPANDASAGIGSWCKPFNPISGVDINNAGVTTISNFTQIQDDGVWGNTSLGGYFAKAGGTGVIGSEFWLQFSVKFSANRFNSNIPRGKFFFITVNNLGTPDQEIVVDAETLYGGGQIYMYTNGGNAWNSFLGTPQDRSSGVTNDSFQPSSTFASTCIVGNSLGYGSNNCVVYPVGQWFTIMFHIKPGVQAVTTNFPSGAQNSATANPSNANDTLVEMFIAPQGQTTWTTVFSANQQFQFETSPPALGWNIMSCQDFTGGGAEVQSPELFTHEWDQIILSTQVIPCPLA